MSAYLYDDELAEIVVPLHDKTPPHELRVPVHERLTLTAAPEPDAFPGFRTDRYTLVVRWGGSALYRKVAS